MARNAIIDKLQRSLAQDITSEAQVVYILVEIRKLIDAENDESYASLKLYCDWAVHTELTYPSRTRPILTLVDNDLFNCFDPSGHGVAPEEHEKLEKLLYLDGFRADLLAFLRNNGLPRAIAEEDKRWFNFLKYYAHVIEDCSLVYKSDDLKMIRQMTFKKNAQPQEKLPFTIAWKLTLKDGTVMSWNLSPTWKLLGTMITVR